MGDNLTDEVKTDLVGETDDDEFFSRVVAKLKQMEYSGQKLQLAEANIFAYGETAKAVLKQYLDGDEDADIELCGYKLSFLREKLGIDFISALTIIDWLEKEPEAAKLAIVRGCR